MAKKYIDVLSLRIGVGKDLIIRKHKENGKMAYYLSVDSKFSDDYFRSRRLSPEEAKEVLKRELPDSWTDWAKREPVERKKSEILEKYF